jgi:hypothetical protein
MKLTDAQYKVVVELLTYQFMGYYISLGKRLNFNDNQIGVVKTREVFNNGVKIMRNPDTAIRVGNGVYINTLRRAEVIYPVKPTSQYDEFYNYAHIDVLKVLEYEDGEKAIHEAVDKLKEHK